MWLLEYSSLYASYVFRQCSIYYIRYIISLFFFIQNSYYFLIYIITYFAVLQTETRALCMLGKRSRTKLYPQQSAG